MSRRAAFARRGVRAELAVDLLRTPPGDSLRTSDRLLLLAVAIKGQVSLAELASILGVKMPTARRAADGMVKAGWIEQVPYLLVPAYRPAKQLADAAHSKVSATR